MDNNQFSEIVSVFHESILGKDIAVYGVSHDRLALLVPDVVGKPITISERP